MAPLAFRSIVNARNVNRITNALSLVLIIPTPTRWLFLGPPMLMDSHTNQHQAGVQNAVWRPKQEETRPKARSLNSSLSGRGVSGQVVSLLALYFNNPNSNPTKIFYSCS